MKSLQNKDVEEKDINNLQEFWKKHPVVSILIIFLLIGVVTSITNSSIDTSSTAKINKEHVAVEETSPVEQKDIRITFQTVKKVEDKYRYFFDIRNYEEESIEAEVEIELLKNNGRVTGRETFVPSRPIEPEYGDSVYFDIRTGPVPQFDIEYAAVGFRYEVTIDDAVVSSGNGSL